MKSYFVKSIFLATASTLAFAGPTAAKWPEKPIELVCTTKPGSGAADWCRMLAEEFKKPDSLGVPVNVIFKSGGGNHEPSVYVKGKPADGYTMMHVSASFKGYFNMPHFKASNTTYNDFSLIARVEKHLYAIAVRCDNPLNIKSWKDLVGYAKKNPGKLAMGSNKPGSNHHRHHAALFNDFNLNVRFIPYQGTGKVVKDVVGKHLPVGFAQPGKWDAHVKAGTVCPLAVLNEKRLNVGPWKDVPTILEVGGKYSIPHQWQGLMVKKGTPPEAMAKIAAAAKAVTESENYKKRWLQSQFHVVPEFHGDAQKLDAYFKDGLNQARKFMIEHKIIKEGS